MVGSAVIYSISMVSLVIIGCLGAVQYTHKCTCIWCVGEWLARNGGHKCGRLWGETTKWKCKRKKPPFPLCEWWMSYQLQSATHPPTRARARSLARPLTLPCAMFTHFADGSRSSSTARIAPVRAWKHH